MGDVVPRFQTHEIVRSPVVGGTGNLVVDLERGIHIQAQFR